MQRGSPATGVPAALGLLIHHSTRKGTNMNQRTRSTRLIVGLTLAPIVVVLLAIAFVASKASAADSPVVGPVPVAGLPFCGGQGAPAHPASATSPYRCGTKVRRIDGTPVWADVTANGTNVFVTIHLLAPRTVPTPVKIVHHQGNSGAGLELDSAKGTVPAGVLTITLVDSSPCRDGQLDIKFVFIANSQEQGRIGGPRIQNGADCTSPSTTVATTVPPGTTPSTGGTTSPTSTVPTTPTVGTVRVLPATGTGIPWAVIVVLIVAGLVLIVVTRLAR